jgi:16S rRNA (guanine(527)-N(7))-methyltransferase RsmG
MTDLLATFARELLRWNERINLTSARDLDDAMRHIRDSAAVIPHIPADARRVLDVGSGGGLPAAIIAIQRPDLAVTALEPVHKKHAFLQHARRLLCPNLDPRAERLEQHDGRDYDAAISRATFALPEWLEMARPFVRPGGVVLGMEGADAVELPAGAERHPYDLDDRTRAIIVLRV